MLSALIHPDRHAVLDAVFADIAYARGEARGEANALLAVLTARGIAVPADIRTRITSCTDTEQLADWLVKAATATTATQVFG